MVMHVPASLYLTLLEVAIKYSFFEENRDIVIRGRNMYNPNHYNEISLDLLLFTGIFQSVRFNGYTVCCSLQALLYALTAPLETNNQRRFMLYGCCEQ
jgi:superfamily II RNA helicase